MWTGKQMLVFERTQPQPPTRSVDIAAAYNPTTNTWRRLRPFNGPRGNAQGDYEAVWTGKEMLVFGTFDSQAFDPLRNRWRQLATPNGIGGLGLRAWTGHEMIDWGGGCCGDASAVGYAFHPATNTWRKLARSPLTPSQDPSGAWTGRELIVLVSGFDPEAKPYPARLARAAAYDPTTNSWRRIAPPPASRDGATVVWDGREVLVIGGVNVPPAGGSRAPRDVLAYNPATNRWRQLAPMNSARTQFASVWTGKQLLIWSGTTRLAAPPQSPPSGLAYDPSANRWSALPQAPLSARLNPCAVWTGHAMIVWGGTGRSGHIANGAAFTPATR